MSKGIRDLLFTVVVLSAMAGCTEPPPLQEDHVHFMVCSVKVIDPEEVPTDAYVLELDPQKWRVNAPLLASAFDAEIEKGRPDLPTDIGGLCDEGYQDEVEWMIDHYKHTPGAHTTPGRSTPYFYFSLFMNGTGWVMNANGDWYGYPDGYP